jgi:glutamine cyclotransferase
MSTGEGATGVGGRDGREGRATADEAAAAATTPDAACPATYGYVVVNAFPHDPQAFTQGLFFHEGTLIESTGLVNRSTLRRVELETGRVLQQVEVPRFHFAEGAALLGGRIYQLTWKTGKGFVYDAETFEKMGEFAYDGDGWGLTRDGESLILSDGTDALRFLDPETFRATRTIKVADRNRPLFRLNDLEYVAGEIFANVWRDSRVARISPRTGAVVGWVELNGLLRPGEVRHAEGVLNGIAYDADHDRLFVTGKFWPQLFEIRLERK